MRIKAIDEIRGFKERLSNRDINILIGILMVAAGATFVGDAAYNFGVDYLTRDGFLSAKYALIAGLGGLVFILGFAVIEKWEFKIGKTTYTFE